MAGRAGATGRRHATVRSGRLCVTRQDAAVISPAARRGLVNAILWVSAVQFALALHSTRHSLLHDRSNSVIVACAGSGIPMAQNTRNGTAKSCASSARKAPSPSPAWPRARGVARNRASRRQAADQRRLGPEDAWRHRPAVDGRRGAVRAAHARECRRQARHRPHGRRDHPRRRIDHARHRHHDQSSWRASCSATGG